MILLYIILLLLTFWQLHPRTFNEEYLSRGRTTSVKGIFVLMVFFSHFSTYVSPDGGRADALFYTVNNGIGQLMVVMFLFYSGYGIMYRILDTPGVYLRGFLRKRFFSTWLRFALCVLLFILLHLLRGTLQNYSLNQILLAFTGWTSIGNSNWFMFDTFCMYAGIALVFLGLRPADPLIGLSCFSLLGLCLTALLPIYKESWWWDTLLCFPLGMWFAVLRDTVEARLKQPGLYTITLGAHTCAFAFLWLIQHNWGLGGGYVLYAMLFALLVVLVTMKVQIGNPILDFFGRHLFSIYILQRIPMILLQGMVGSFGYFALCLLSTVLLAVCFDKCYAVLQKQLIRTNAP